MEKRIKAALSGLLALILALSLFVFDVPMAKADASDFLYTDVGSNEVKITGYNVPDGFDGNITIPRELGGKTVTQIGDSAFENCDALVSVSFESGSGVSNIGILAFQGCDLLESIMIPASVTAISTSAFEGCVSLEGITVDPDNQFFSSDVLGVLFDKGKETLYRYPIAKSGTYTVPGTVKTISSLAFSGCVSLTGITLQEGLTNIGDHAFSGSCITTVGIPDSVTRIENYAFSDCQFLNSVGFQESALLESIGDYAFSSCISLAGINIPANVTYIGLYAFAYCESLTGIYIPANVSNIRIWAFDYCNSMTAIEVDPDNQNYADVDGVLFDKNVETLYRYPVAKSGSYTTPDSVRTISAHSFRGSTNIIGITFKEGVRDIESHAFDDCSLTSLYIPSTVSGIGEGEGSYAFPNCFNLESITVNPDNPYYCSVDGVLFSKDKTSLLSFPANYPGESYSIPSTISYINSITFAGSKIKEINIPASVTVIANKAFLDCSNLTSVTIPASVTYISDHAFQGCSNLNSAIFLGTAPESNNDLWGECGVFLGTPSGFKIYYMPGDTSWGTDWYGYLTAPFLVDGPYQYIDLGDNKAEVTRYTGSGEADITVPGTLGGEKTVTAIGDYAFTGHGELESAVLPATVTRIGNNAFYDCGSLQSVNIPDGVTHIGNSAFRWCYSLAGITLPEGLTGIGDSAFAECSNLTEIIIPGSVKSIGEYAFESCFGLKGNITIPAGVTSIGAIAFGGCDSLANIFVETGNPNYYDADGVLLNKNKTLMQYPQGNTRTSFDIPTDVVKIDDFAFSGNGYLNSVKIPSSVRSIGSFAFSGMNALANAEISPGVTSIGDFAFSSCGLTGITIPDSVMRIGIEAFANCDSLSTVTIPANVELLGRGAFVNCDSLVSITVDEDNPNYASENGALFNKDKTTLLLFPAARNQMTYAIPSGVESIGAGAFKSDSDTHSSPLTFHAMRAGSQMLDSSIALTSVVIPASVWSIGDEAFMGRGSLTAAYFIGNAPDSDDFGSDVFKGTATDFTIYYMEGTNGWGTTTTWNGYPLAKWTGYTVTFDSHGGSAVASQTIPDKGLVSRPGDPASADPGYKFGGWYKDMNYTIPWDFASDTVTGPTTLHAKWTGNPYSVTFDPQNGTVSPPDKTVTYGGTYGTLPTPERSGYAFGGWFTGTSGNGTKIEPSTTVSITANQTLYAKWMAKTESATISPTSRTFDKNTAYQADVTTTITWNDAGEVTDVKSDKISIGKASYGVSGKTLTVKKEYLATKAVGDLVLAVVFDECDPATLTIAIIDTTPDTPAPSDPKPIHVNISCTKTDVRLYGGSDGTVTISASGGNSGAFEYSINGGASWQGANVFGGLAAATYTAAVRDAAYPSNTAVCSVTIGQPANIGNVPANKVPPKANAGTAVTVVPLAAPKGYTTTSVTYLSSNPSIASVDANGNVTFLAGGKVTIVTKIVSRTTDKNGKVKIKTTTVKKTITVKQPVASVTLNMGSAIIARKGNVKLAAFIAPATASTKKLKWTSSDPKVASVSGAGVVTGKAGGTAVIICTATDGSGVSASCTVMVTPIYPTALKLSKAALTVKLNKMVALKATIMPKTTDFKTVTWTSSNPAVAIVDAKGKVKGVALGAAIITATTSNGITVSCTVIVQ